MPIPRYREKNIAERTGGGIVAQASSQAASNIGQRIQAFEGLALQESKQEALGQAEKDFAKKVLAGDDFSTINDNTIYAQKYNSLTKNAFMAEASQAARNKGVELSAQFKDNPEGFKESMNAYGKAIETKGIDDTLSAHGKQEFEVVRDAMYSKLKANWINNRGSKNELGNKYLLSQLEDKVSRSFIELGNTDPTDNKNASDKFNASVAEYASFLNTQAKAGYIAASSIPMRLEIVKKTAYKQYIKSGISKAEADGTQVGFLAKFNNMDHGSTNLTLNEIEDLRDEVYDSIKKKNSAHSDVLKRQKIDYENGQNKMYKDIKLSMITNPISAQNQIKAAYFNDNITKATKNELMEELRDADSFVSTPEVLNSLTAFPLSYTSQEILDHSQLSNKDKRMFLEKINSRPSFTSDTYYREGTKEIMGHFGFVEGTLAGKLDLNNKNTQLFNLVSTRYFDEVSKLAPAERSEKALGIARSLLGSLKSRAKENETKRKDAREKKFKESKSYNKKPKSKNEETLAEGMNNGR